MTLDQFRILSEMEQLSAICQGGKLMAQTADTYRRIFLYQFKGFYVAATYSCSSDQLISIECFLEIDLTTPHFRRQLFLVNPAERADLAPGA
jgi:hypothetical protein